jgi:activator of HSP90 ATPase
MLDTHGKDLQVGTPSASGTSTPVSSGPTAASSAIPHAATAAKPKPAGNTKNVKVEATFAAPADELFSLFTDEKRIPAWTRAPAVSGGKPDTEYSMFGGGVKGKYVSLTPAKEIVQTWALSSPSWPSAHQATLTTTLEQSSDSTKVTWSLVGVPVGMEDEITQNINGY